MSASRQAPAALPHRWPTSWRELWRLLNPTLPVEPAVVRTLCLSLAIGYLVVTLVRVIVEGPAFVALRLSVPLYVAAGAVAARRFSWTGLRLYIVGIALLVPLSTSYMEAMRGYQPGDLALLAVATFVPLPFLLTITDLLCVDAVLLLSNRLLFALAPDPVSTPDTVWIVLLGSLIVGTACSVLLITYRSLTYETLAWWQQSFERERVLREFAETAASSATSPALLGRLATHFADTIPDGVAFVVLAEPDAASARARVVGGGGPASRRIRVPDALVDALWQRLEGSRVPLTQAALEPAELTALASVLAPAIEPAGVAVLPMAGLVRGFIVVIAPSAAAVSEERLAMWHAMAKQAGVAAANARAWDELRAREADARRLAEERGRLAEVKTRFVSMASHEFRTPLASILASSEILKRYGERSTPEERAQRLDRIHAQVQHMTRMLDDVLVVGAGDAGKLACRRERLDLAALCQTIVQECESTATAVHRLVLESRGATDDVWVDPALVRQILGNLLSNGIKYSPEGGTVRLEVACADGQAILTVRDQGLGIAPEDQERLFEAFQRGVNVGAIPGTGLGLAITRNAVAAHGGTIAVESLLGDGTTFVVRLPVTPPDADTAAVR